MHLNTFTERLENNYMFRPDDETDSGYIEDLILEGDTIVGEYDDSQDYHGDDEDTN